MGNITEVNPPLEIILEIEKYRGIIEKYREKTEDKQFIGEEPLGEKWVGEKCIWEKFVD